MATLVFYLADRVTFGLFRHAGRTPETSLYDLEIVRGGAVVGEITSLSFAEIAALSRHWSATASWS